MGHGVLMAKSLHRLSDAQIKNHSANGHLSDGGRSLLKIRNDGRANSWIFRCAIKHKQIWMGNQKRYN